MFCTNRRKKEKERHEYFCLYYLTVNTSLNNQHYVNHNLKFISKWKHFAIILNIQRVVWDTELILLSFVSHSSQGSFILMPVIHKQVTWQSAP